MPERIVLKETSTYRLAGRRRKMVVTKTEMMYVPLLKTLEAQLNIPVILREVCMHTGVYNMRACNIIRTCML